VKPYKTKSKLAKAIAAAVAVSSAGFVNADDHYALFGMPDFDQRRSGLGGNGSMYCVPTSTYNIFNFMAHHGLTAMYNNPLDPGNLILNANPYVGHTLRISSVGSFMGTDAVNGTGGNGWTSGIIDYIEYVSNLPLLEISYSSSPGFPSPKAMMPWMRVGGMIDMSYGRYTMPYSSSKVRTGGHAITLVSVAYKTGISSVDIGYQDPAADEGSGDPNQLTQQSPFATTLRTTYPEFADFDGQNCTLYGIGSKPADPTKTYAYIDGYRLLLPLCAMTNVVNSDNFHLHLAINWDAEKQLYNPRALANVDIGGLSDHTGDFIMDPVLPRFVRTMPKSRQLVVQDVLGRDSFVLATAPATPIGLEFGGPNMDLFVLQADRINKLGRDGKWASVRQFSWRLESEVFDPSTGQVIIGGGPNLQTVNGDLRALRHQTLKELDGEGRQFLRIEPRSGDLFVMRRGSPLILRYRRSTDGSFALSSRILPDNIVSPDSFDLANGELFVSERGLLHEFTLTGRARRATNFDGSEAGDLVRFAHSFNNWTPGAYPLPNWRDLPNPGVPRP
jgi:hypothetical protein